MCYHFALVKAKASDLINNKVVSLEKIKKLEDNYHISGFQNIACPVITNTEKDEFNFFEWGLIPNWTANIEKAEEIRKITLNAKAETVFEKPSFSESIISRRCLIPATGFYEWYTIKNGAKSYKYPYYISMQNDEMFVFGGIWDSYKNMETGQIIDSFSIITTQANELMAEIHNLKRRMPLIIPPEKACDWLVEDIKEEEIRDFMKPFDSEKMKAFTIGKQISSNQTEKIGIDIQKPVFYPELQYKSQKLF
ncbi:MAG: SOS response-associated peptidase [Bacteroidales bacterium]|nr:SOS response-associated peptidase [Bacteroidales bacterium]